MELEDAIALVRMSPFEFREYPGLLRFCTFGHIATPHGVYAIPHGISDVDTARNIVIMLQRANKREGEGNIG